VAYHDGSYYGYEEGGLLVISQIPPWRRSNVVGGQTNPDGSVTTIETDDGAHLNFPRPAH
jgi:hypothetical protein